jgi:Family of unknown function (DUF6515)
MKLAEKFLATIVFTMVLSSVTVGMVFGGVKQTRTANNTNIGTNPYKDLDTNSGDNYATVNPNYSGQTAMYQGENGMVPVNPVTTQALEDGSVMYNGYDVVVTGGYYYDYNDWSASVAPGTLIPIGTILQNLPSSAVPVMVNSARYYYLNNVFLSEVYDGNTIVYQIVPAPLGAVITQMPVNCTVRNFNGKSLSVCGSTVYQQVAGGFQVVGQN